MVSYNSFNCPKDKLNVSIDSSVFSPNGLALNVKDSEGRIFKGELFFTDTVPVESRLLNPGIMGWYQLIPGMECMHGLVSAKSSCNRKTQYRRRDL